MFQNSGGIGRRPKEVKNLSDSWNILMGFQPWTEKEKVNLWVCVYQQFEIFIVHDVAIIMQQLVQAKAGLFIHLCNHSWSGVNLRGIWVRHDQIHYARPRLCPHVAWKKKTASIYHISIFKKLWGQLILYSACVKPRRSSDCESVQSLTVWNCHIQSHTWCLWKQIKSHLNPNVSTATGRISMWCAST